MHMASKDTKFKKGHPGGPGRPKGARNKVTDIYLDALASTTTDDVLQVVEKLKVSRPDAYLKLLSALVPRDLDINHSGNLSVSVIDYKDDSDS